MIQCDENHFSQKWHHVRQKYNDFTVFVSSIGTRTAGNGNIKIVIGIRMNLKNNRNRNGNDVTKVEGNGSADCFPAHICYRCKPTSTPYSKGVIILTQVMNEA